ncbi:MAG: amidohydrolase family protein [Smithellaceae bacterium]
MTRRQLMQKAAASAVLLGLPPVSGCSSLPEYQPVGVEKGKALYLTSARVIDVIRGVVEPGRTLTIRHGIIESVSGFLPVLHEGDKVLDLKGDYVLPGLIDAHCHATLSGEFMLSPATILTTINQMNRNYIQQIKQGITTIRDMGAMPDFLHNDLEKIQTGKLIGPRIVYCNAFTNIFGSHPDIDPAAVSIFARLAMAFTGHPNLWFRNTDDLKHKLRQNTRRGASFVKLTMDGISLLCGKGKIPVYTDEHLKIIFDFAQKNHLSTAAHIHTKFGFDRAVRFGIGSMEHLLADAILTRQDVETMAEKNIAIVPTMTIAQLMAAPEAYFELPVKYRTGFIQQELEIRRRYLHESDHTPFAEAAIHKSNLAYLANYRKYGCARLYEKDIYMANPELYFDILRTGPANLLAMKDAGVVIGCGTDAGVPFAYHGTLWREMEMLGRLGFSAADILRAATINNAKILGMADQIGSLEAGKFADCVVLKENPLAKIEACRHPQTVIKDGLIYDVGKIVFNP